MWRTSVESEGDYIMLHVPYIKNNVVVDEALFPDILNFWRNAATIFLEEYACKNGTHRYFNLFG